MKRLLTLSASWMVSLAKVLTLAPASARAVPQGQIVSADPGRLQNRPLLNGRELMGSVLVDGSVLASNLVQRASKTLVRAAAIEPENILQKAANFMWLL